MVSVIDQLNKNLITSKLIEDLLKATEKSLKTHVNNKVTLVQSALSGKARGLKTFVVDVSKSLGRRLAVLETNTTTTPTTAKVRIQAMDREEQAAKIELRLLKLKKPNNMSVYMGTDERSMAASVETIIEERLNSLDTVVGKLFVRDDDISIKFSGLGFTKPPDVNSWLEKELPHHPAGLIVNAHMGFERVFYNMDNTDTLTRLQQCYKIKVTTIADGVTISSFDSKIPKFLLQSHGHKVVKTDGSFLDAISSYQEWDDPGMGYRLRLQEELANFEEIHGTYLDEYFSCKSGQGYAIC
jgi:hypothetical protein